MSGSCRFPEGRRLDGACNFILSNAKLRSQAKDIVDDFLSTNKDLDDVSWARPPISHAINTRPDCPWSEKSELLKNELVKQVTSLKRQVLINGQDLYQRKHGLMKFMKLVRTNSLLAADLLHEGKEGVSGRRGLWIKRKKVRCCMVTNEQQCTETAVLYSKYCLGHITADKRQVLYQTCIAPDSDTLLRCNRPILELLQDKPYCRKHASMKVETKTKTAIKLAPPVRAGGRGGKRKISPGRQKIKETTKKSVISQPPSLITPPLPPPLLTQSLPQPLPLLPSLGPSWSSPESEEGESKHRQEYSSEVGQGLSPTKMIPPLLSPANQMGEANEQLQLLPFSPDPTHPPPLTLSTPPVLLLPPGPTLGSFLDDSSSSEDK